MYSGLTGSSRRSTTLSDRARFNHNMPTITPRRMWRCIANTAMKNTAMPNGGIVLLQES